MKSESSSMTEATTPTPGEASLIEHAAVDHAFTMVRQARRELSQEWADRIDAAITDLIALVPERSSSLMLEEAATGLSDLIRAYVNLLEGGRDRILMLGGDCDPVDVMERGNPDLNAAKSLLTKLRDRS